MTRSRTACRVLALIVCKSSSINAMLNFKPSALLAQNKTTTDTKTRLNPVVELNIVRVTTLDCAVTVFDSGYFAGNMTSLSRVRRTLRVPITRIIFVETSDRSGYHSIQAAGSISYFN
eukprot:scaffold170307_cov49-Prasinocladus_malaysianus.AAC.3